MPTVRRIRPAAALAALLATAAAIPAAVIVARAQAPAAAPAPAGAAPSTAAALTPTTPLTIDSGRLVWGEGTYELSDALRQIMRASDQSFIAGTEVRGRSRCPLKACRSTRPCGCS